MVLLFAVNEKDNSVNSTIGMFEVDRQTSALVCSALLMQTGM